jgi:hypothetical protein
MHILLRKANCDADMSGAFDAVGCMHESPESFILRMFHAELGAVPRAGGVLWSRQVSGAGGG